ncbi:MAG: glycosyltransferase [Sphaerospermopsis sp. SIO1G1]|nr:glycosyltransferase [Sphaerospermopsis sp. SIO1G1]
MQDLHLPLVSILINNYNYGNFLTEAIDSALNQTYSNIEVIVVDDGSTDNSHEIIKSYEDRIIPVLKTNGGQASAFNLGFANSKGEIICFLDADDLFLPGKIKQVVHIFQDYPDTGWFFHKLEFFGNYQNQSLQNSQNRKPSGRYDFREKIISGKLRGTMPSINLATSAMCFRRSLLQAILPMPDEIRITSDDYIKYIALGTSPGYICLDKLSCQRIHNNNAYTARSDIRKQRTSAKINILTAYWMKYNFPDVMLKFANNIFAIAVSLYWVYGDMEGVCEARINRYLSSLSLMEKTEIYARIYYNYFKILYQKILSN